MKLVWRTIRQFLLYVTCLASISVFAGSYLYHGCYQYSALTFLNGSTYGNPEQIHPNMTVDMCLYECRPTTFTHVALQVGTQCLCANLTNKNEIDNAECSKNCPGNTHEKCGGSTGILSVYSNVSQSSTESTSDVSTSTTTIHDTSQGQTTSTPIMDTSTVQGQAPTTSTHDCLCKCDEMRDVISLGSLTQDEQEKMMDTILEDFKVKMENLSSTIRRKSSAKDKRTAAAAIGYVGITILAVAFGLLVIPDFISLFRYLLVFIKRKWQD